jgi:two-component system, OmpR family, copper resistance phosphate regulon response regulator CusR
MSRVLIAEDNRQIAAFVDKGLRAAGYQTEVVGDGISALHGALDGDFDLLVLDLGLPGKDGFTVLDELRGQGATIPVIILTARDTVQDTVAGLEGGANDYVTKPFQFAELLARVRLRLRESDESATPGSGSTVLRAGQLELDLHARTVRVPSGDYELTAREFAMLEVFLRHPNQILSRQQLLGHVWGVDFETTSNVVDVCVRSLRRKIGAERIQTVRNAGYRLAP